MWRDSESLLRSGVPPTAPLERKPMTLAEQIERILQEQHIPWGAQTYARDLRRRLEEVIKANEGK